MIEAKRIGLPNAGKEFAIVYGDFDPTKEYDAIGAHEHFGDDTTSLIRRMVRGAVDEGLDFITVTDHDTTRKQDKVQRIIDKHRYPIQMLPGVEVTARSPALEPRHILVYGAEEAPPPGLSPAEVNQWAHDLSGDVRTAVAHPELWKFSVTKEELAGIQSGERNSQFDWGEVINGGAMRVDAFRRDHPRLSRLGFVDKRIPKAGTNDRMREVLEPYEGDLPYLGGADGHEWDGMANIVNLVPKGRTLIDAVDARENVVIQKSHVKGLPYWRIGLSIAREIPIQIHEHRMQRRLGGTQQGAFQGANV